MRNLLGLFVFCFCSIMGAQQAFAAEKLLVVCRGAVNPDYLSQHNNPELVVMILQTLPSERSLLVPLPDTSFSTTTVDARVAVFMNAGHNPLVSELIPQPPTYLDGGQLMRINNEKLIFRSHSLSSNQVDGFDIEVDMPLEDSVQGETLMVDKQSPNPIYSSLNCNNTLIDRRPTDMISQGYSEVLNSLLEDYR